MENYRRLYEDLQETTFDLKEKHAEEIAQLKKAHAAEIAALKNRNPKPHAVLDKLADKQRKLIQSKDLKF